MAKRELHAASVVDGAFEKVAEAAHLLGCGRADQHIAVLPLDLGRPEVFVK